MKNEVLNKDMSEIYTAYLQWEKLNGATIMLTGPYGMLASYIVYFICYLVEEKNFTIRLIALGRSKEKFIKRFSDIDISNKDYVLFRDDSLDNELCIDDQIDYIIHAASLASPQHYSVRPVDVLKPNVIGNYHLLQLARAKNVKGYLLFSTGDIYGSVKDTKIITENDYGVMDTLDIHNCYSESKRMAETMCKAFYQQYNVPVKIARIWHTYSPTMDIENDPRVFSSFVKNIVHGENIEMKSDGSGKRCFCYITDAVSGYFKILLDGESGEAYNVCNEDEFVSVSDLANKLVAIFPEKGLKVIRKERSKDENYNENVLLLNHPTCPSSAKLRALGWEHNISIEEGFRRCIESFLSET